MNIYAVFNVNFFDKLANVGNKHLTSVSGFNIIHSSLRHVLNIGDLSESVPGVDIINGKTYNVCDKVRAFLISFFISIVKSFILSVVYPLNIS